MARYFLHLRSATDEPIDEEGLELASMDALGAAMLHCARDVIVGDVVLGTIDLRHRIDAETIDGAIVATLPFDRAVTLVRAN